jgi:hypothetical protein
LFAYGVARARTFGARVSWLAAALAVVVALVSIDRTFAGSFALIVAAYGYYVSAGALVFRLHPLVADERIGRDSLFCIAFVAFVAAPTYLFRFFGVLTLLVVGWFMVLSAYSYCVEIGRQRYTARLADFLFFTLVDPATSLTDRSQPSAQRLVPPGTLARLCGGLLVALIAQLTINAFPMIARVAHFEGGLAARYATLLMQGSLAFAAIYGLRAGLAEVHIRLLTSLGYSVPIAYDRPHLAKSPRDFWTRWNLYVGRWARRYLFSPTALYVARRSTRWPLSVPRMPQAIAVLATFVAIGLLHDALNLAGEGTTELVYLKVFGFAAVGLLLWEGASLAIKAALPSLVARVPAAVTSVLSRVGLLHYVVMLLVLMGRI